MTGDSARLGIALCASAFAHAWLLAAHPGGPSVRAYGLPAWTAINARIAVAPSDRTEHTARDLIVAPPIDLAHDKSRAEALARARTPRAEIVEPPGARRSKVARSMEEARAASNSARLPAAVDTTWYTAQDIDTYPAAGGPVRLTLPTGATAARLLLWLRIDEHGAVVEVSAGEPGIPPEWVDAARASLSAIRFAPARKDDRAVRSRLLLSVSFAGRE